VVTALRREGIPGGSAALAVAMVTREHSRPESELLDIVRQYQALESSADALEAIADLRRRGWLMEEISYGVALVQQAPDLKHQLALVLKDPTIESRLSMLRSVHDPYVRIIGQMNDSAVYTTYLNLLRNAQSEICLPMLATTPKLNSVPILQDRAEKGVRVRVLLGATDVVGRLRGEIMRGVAADSIAGWRAHARGRKCFELRIAHEQADMELATCMLIDGTVLRFDVYDPRRQRSLQGVMIEVSSPHDLELNLVRLFKDRFEEAWSHSRPAGLPQVLWWLKREARWVAAGATVLIAFLFRNDNFGLAVTGSIAATQVTNAVASSWHTIRTYVWKQR
jgi:hypothetical protein